AAAPAAPVPVNFWGPFTVLAEAARNRTFWILAGTCFICGLSTNGLVQTHFISLCGDNGLGVVPAASVLSMMGVFDLVGTTLSGYLSDRFDNRKLLFWYYGLRGLSLFWLPYSAFTLYGLSMFALFYGLDWVAPAPPPPPPAPGSPPRFFSPTPRPSPPPAPPASSPHSPCLRSVGPEESSL